MKITVRALGWAAPTALVLAGCGKHYWNKPGAGAEEFATDRARHHEPPAGWFRGIETADPVRLDGPAPPPQPRSSVPPAATGLGADNTLYRLALRKR